MPIPGITRTIQTVEVSATYSLTNPDIEQIVADATDAGFTITLYNDTNSGSYHRVVVKVSDDDVSGNTVTIVDAIGVFSTTLASTSAAVELETDQDGNWIAVASFPTLDANTAISAADSAGLEASVATSASDSAALNASSATSASTSAGLQTSSTTSSAASLVITDSTTRSIAASATLSGVSATASVATSQNTSQSLNISSTGSVATSQNASQSLNVSTALSTAVS